MLNLIRRLPADSQLSREVNGDSAEWSRTDHLLAVVADQLAHLQWAYATVHSDSEPPKPAPISRPGVTEDVIPAASNADIASFMAS
jgi:hypothetical protein